MNGASGSGGGYNNSGYYSNYDKKRNWDDRDDRDNGRDRPSFKKERTTQSEFPKRPSADHQLSTMNKPSAPYLKWIAEGLKKAEGRVNGDFYRRYQVGHTVCMHNFREYVLCKIVYLNKYSSFREMIEKEGLRNLLPTTKTIEEGVKVYEGFPGAHRVKDLGALAIGVEPIKRFLSSEGREIDCVKKVEEKNNKVAEQKDDKKIDKAAEQKGDKKIDKVAEQKDDKKIDKAAEQKGDKKNDKITDRKDETK